MSAMTTMASFGGAGMANAEEEQQRLQERHREEMREKKRARDRQRRRLETIETRKKVMSGELSVHPEAVRARKRRMARWHRLNNSAESPTSPTSSSSQRDSFDSTSVSSSAQSSPVKIRRSATTTSAAALKNNDEASVASILVGLLTKKTKNGDAMEQEEQRAAENVTPSPRPHDQHVFSVPSAGFPRPTATPRPSFVVLADNSSRSMDLK
mmetsp:Transcript_15078/g.45657  ORF Transcript_15078/g.45657 Transcript_15078/m.45657 type:complete len:211 (+) Transcript_15078:398-1030(+)